jgi:type II secretory pathway component PulF
MFFGYITLGFTPRYEKVFEGMLGDRSKLPAHTQLVIGVSRFIQGNVIFLGPLLVFLMPILLWMFRGGKAVSVAVMRSSD